MAVISVRETKKIADLAHLIFRSEELRQFVPQFREILDFFKQLDTISTEDIEPTYQALERKTSETPIRKDEVMDSLTVGKALGNTPDVSEEHFRVPAVIED